MNAAATEIACNLHSFEKEERPYAGDRLLVRHLGEVALRGPGYLPPGNYEVTRVIGQWFFVKEIK